MQLRFFKTQKLSYIAIVLMLCLLGNVLFQNFQPLPVTNYENLDLHSYFYMSAEAGAWEKPFGQNSYFTYGPFFKYFNSDAFPFSEAYYFLKFLSILLFAGIFFSYSIRSEFRYTPWILCFFFAFYNFPGLHQSPLILLIWSLAFPIQYEKRIAVLQYILACSFTAISFLYKPSWGVACGLQISLSILFHPFFKQNKRILWLACYSISCLGLAYICYVATTANSLQQFYLYVIISLKDASQYSALMSVPYAGHLKLVTYYPFFIFLFLVMISCYKVYRQRVWLACLLFPILFIDFKHSYVRADVTNIYSIFWIFPLALFFTLIRFWNCKILRYTNLFILFVLTLLDLSGATPYNIPWRHPRHFWYLLPHQYQERFNENKKTSEKHFETHLEKYDWVREKVQDESLLSIPFQAVLSKLSNRALVLPSIQNYFGFGEHPRREIDLDWVKKNQPSFVLFQDINYDLRSSMDCRPEFYIYLFQYYSIVERRGDFYLFKRNVNNIKEIKKKYQLKKSGVQFPYRISFDAPLSSFIKLKLNTNMNFIDKMKLSFAKGDKIKFDWVCGDLKRTYLCDEKQLNSGVFIVPELKRLKTEEANIKRVQSFIFHGRLMPNHKMDPFHYLYDSRGSFDIEMMSLTVE